MIANSTSRPFSNLGLHGLILKKGGGKISKYDVDIPIVEDITSHPDNVRLSLLKQKFGIDFYFPDFDEEEKFRRKIENCLNFYINYNPTDRDNENTELESKVEELEINILNKIRRLNFSGAYQDFKSLTYDQISSIIIPSIRSRGISQKSLRTIFLRFMEIANVFTPSTVKKFLERSRKAS